MAKPSTAQPPDRFAHQPRLCALVLKVGRGQGFDDDVLHAIRDHMPASQPATVEGVILRDADILEPPGAVAVLRAVSKVGRDTRFHADAARNHPNTCPVTHSSASGISRGRAKRGHQWRVVN